MKGRLTSVCLKDGRFLHVARADDGNAENGHLSLVGKVDGTVVSTLTLKKGQREQNVAALAEQLKLEVGRHIATEAMRLAREMGIEI